MHDGARRFLEMIARHGGLWRSFDARVVAVRLGDHWHNLRTCITLSSAAARALPGAPKAIQTPSLLSQRIVGQASTLPSVIHQLMEGRWATKKATVLYLQAPTSGTSTVLDLNFGGDSHRGRGSDLPWMTYYVRVSGEGMGNILPRLPKGYGTLDEEIQNSLPVYPNWQEYVKAFTGSRGFDSYNATWLEIIAPCELGISVDDIEIDTKKAWVPIVAATSWAARRARLEMTLDDARVPPIVVRLSKSGWQDQNGYLSALASFALPLNRPFALTLYDDARPVDWHQINHHTSPEGVKLVRAYESIDPDFHWLRSALATEPPSAAERSRRRQEPGKLSGPGDDVLQKYFEEAVGRLFHLAGYQVDRISAKPLSDNVDLLALCRRQQLLLAIECTIGAPDKDGKINTLLARTTTLKKAVGIGAVQGVLATAFPDSAVSTLTRGALQADGLWLCTRERLEGLLQLVCRAAAPEEFLALLSRTE